VYYRAILLTFFNIPGTGETRVNHILAVGGPGRDMALGQQKQRDGQFDFSEKAIWSQDPLGYAGQLQGHRYGDYPRWIAFISRFMHQSR